LLVRDVLHPCHRTSISLLLNGDMAHGRGGRCSVPVLLVWWKPDCGTLGTDAMARNVALIGPARQGSAPATPRAEGHVSIGLCCEHGRRFFCHLINLFYDSLGGSLRGRPVLPRNQTTIDYNDVSMLLTLNIPCTSFY
jgi:hypothetical protein